MDNTAQQGKKTVHVKWNVTTAILVGDVMLVKVYAPAVEGGYPCCSKGWLLLAQRLRHRGVAANNGHGV